MTARLPTAAHRMRLDPFHESVPLAMIARGFPCSASGLFLVFLQIKEV